MIGQKLAQPEILSIGQILTKSLFRLDKDDLHSHLYPSSLAVKKGFNTPFINPR